MQVHCDKLIIQTSTEDCQALSTEKTNTNNVDSFLYSLIYM